MPAKYLMLVGSGPMPIGATPLEPSKKITVTSLSPQQEKIGNEIAGLVLFLAFLKLIS